MAPTLAPKASERTVHAAARQAQPAAAPTPSNDDQGIAGLLKALQGVATSGRAADYLQLLSPTADRAKASEFAETNFRAHVDRVGVRERDRTPLPSAPGEGYRLIVEVLFESGDRGRLATWQLDIRRAAAPAVAAASTPRGAAGGPAREAPPGPTWTISDERELSSLANLYRLGLDPSRQLAGNGIVVTAEDLKLTLSKGSAFVAKTDAGIAALVLLGNGEMTFTPGPASERGQVKLFSGSETLDTRFDSCVVRLNPNDFAAHVALPSAERSADNAGTRQQQSDIRSAVNAASRRSSPDAGELRRAQEVFAQEAAAFTVDLGDLSPGPWSMLPPDGDIVADVHTARFGPLTYSRSGREMEDISLFDPTRQRYVALYASKEKLAARGRFYSDAADADYEVLHYDVNASFAPDRQWIDGRTAMLLRVRADSVSALQVRLADSLAVRSVVGAPFGRLMAVRVRGHDTLIVKLPDMLLRGAQITLTIAYAGRLAPQSQAPEAGSPEAARQNLPPRSRPVDASYLYGAQKAWYPQSPMRGYATASMRLSVPAPYSCVASGRLVSTAAVAGTNGAPPAKEFVFDASRPVRYLACLLGRLREVSVTRPRAKAAGSGNPEQGPIGLTVVADPDDQGPARAVANQAADIAQFYTSLVGDCPYPDLTIAIAQSDAAGGFSPPYLAVLDQPAPAMRTIGRDDPASFPGFPEFFAAHEIAHQWWGQAVGQKNYHEEWLSEGFAQYFAALYAEHAHGPAAFAAILRQMRQWTMRDSAEGPVYLGQRVGQATNDGRALRAVVYDKAALVLHMLRRLVGDDVFFRALRRFYSASKFANAGTDDLRQAFEAESGLKLQPFFERWIYGDTLPRLKFSSGTEPRPDGRENIVIRFEQVGDVFDVPITVTVDYSDRPPATIVVRVNDRVVERRILADGHVRRIDANRDDLAPAAISR